MDDFIYTIQEAMLMFNLSLDIYVYVIARPVVNVTVLTWFISYVYVLHLQFPNNIIYYNVNLRQQ